ncbi:thiol:disulfide interchange protein DsbD [Porphyromonas circumdentaria]|uniref:Thiol:disulfide interchange protein DsbD n=2 Tax=Porphyromonas circumdentaria TaxID=29524 RepID=A0A1T4N5J7_9PORP|nr:thiol:disulfide interchange protein DsbD [Porphyromonas circumdentaria]SJZ74512.1 thiol:disulfide interchange protein DsbD [Porphyromonas circumdentaria]
MNKRTIYRLGFFSLLFTLFLSRGYEMKAQMHLDVLSWKATLEDKGTAEKKIIVTAKIKDGWHLYDQNMPEDGPNSTEFTFYKLQGARKVGGFVADRKATEQYDKQFEMTLRFFDKQVSFVQNIVVTDPEKFYIELGVTAQACDDQACLPPATEEFTFKRTDLKSTAADTSVPEDATQAGEGTTQEALENVEDAAAVSATEGAMSEVSSDKLWTPVVDTLKAYGDETLKQTDSSLLELLLFGFLGGLVALITPCVWPMIPMTVSFFLKRTKDRKKAIKDAIIYGLGIVVIYLVLGLSVTLIFGASMLNNLATNAVFNLIFFAVLVLFAISFFGAFELVLPAKWTNKLDSKSDSTTGVLSLFFMAFTLVLVSFSCTGPIIGTLLVQAASMGDILGPAVGMFGFAVALALPFSLFAIFPNMLQNMPKSGGWLNSVKVVMAFLELALALKFLSIADLAYGWGILDRETFLALWIVIFACLGLYLLGKITFPHDTPLEKVGVGRFFLALISLSFAVYMVPGLWGAPLKAVSAFSPPLSTQDFNLYDGQVHAKFDSYEEGMRYARANNKPVLVDFSGFGCVNCREMENSVWINPKIKSILEEDYVLITLMVDDKTPLPEVIEVEEMIGSTLKRTKLRTIGDKWSYLQRSKFGANAQPFYIPLDHEGVPVGPSYQHDLDVEKYRTYLSDGIKEFKARQAGKPAPVSHDTNKKEVQVAE